MATEDDVNRGVFVNRLSRGHKRTFFSVSVPHAYLAHLEHADERTIAAALDELLQLARGTPGGRTQGAAGGR